MRAAIGNGLRQAVAGLRPVHEEDYVIPVGLGAKGRSLMSVLYLPALSAEFANEVSARSM